MNNKDLQRLEHMKEYIDKINKSKKRFGAVFGTFENDPDYYQSVTMSLFQIGELSNNLTDDFKETTKDEIPWQSIRAVRNLFAHEYGKIDKETIWNTLETDIPKLQRFCESIIDTEKLKEKE